MTTDRTSSIERMLAIPQLFTEAKPIWTVEEVAKALNLSISTAYRYFQSLIKFEYLDEVSGSGYCLGPAFIEFDRSIRVSDPLSRIAGAIISDIAATMDPGTLILLCQVYRKKVMCIHQEAIGPRQTGSSYERGKPMPIFQGATSKVILAHLPWRLQKKEFENNLHERQPAGMGADWKSFSARLRQIRKQGYCVSKGEVDAGRMGIAAPIFNASGQVVRSLSAVVWQDGIDTIREHRLITTIVAAASQITKSMSNTQQADPANTPEAGTPRQANPQHVL